MSRPLRIEFPGAWYHVMNRGRRREDIFSGPEDYTAFLQVLKEAAEQWNLKVAAYCLMSNHYHLLLQTPEGNLSRCMRHLNGVYTQRYNRLRGFDGQLFRGRYKAVLVEADSHLLEVLRYIHRNPLRAGLVDDLGAYPWSSHRGYLSTAGKWEWLHKAPLLSMFGDKPATQMSAYRKFASLADSEETERFYSLKNLPSVLGGDTFKDWLKEKFAHLRFRKEIPESNLLAPSPEAIVAAVCERFKVTRADLLASRRGRENLPRNTAVYLLRTLTRKTLPEIGDYFGVAKESTVGSAVERMKKREATDLEYRKTLQETKRLIIKS